MSSRLATEKMIGVMRTTVVTLSRKAETIAVTAARMIRSRIGWPCDRRTERMARSSKNPVFARTDAITIIPASRKMTFRSIAANASCWSRTPRTMTSIAPMSAMSVRSHRSIVMRT